jgi:dihydroneopterin triphosphate diphosphatase
VQVRLYVSCFVVRRANGTHEFLQLRREPSRYMGGTWQLVTGGVEQGETAWQAALRELREETGLTPAEFYQVDVVNTFYLAASDSIMHSPMFCAIVPADATVVLNHENTAFRWVSRDELESKLMWPGERMAASELCREILDDGPAKPHLRLDVDPGFTRP